MQREGLIVAMTGDAVNDAAALKQADIGVAMGSGSEVTKQAGRMILTDDNFGTLVHAVEIGRRVYEKIVSYVRFQMTQLLALVILFVVASAFNVNKGVALTPSMVLYLLFFVTVPGVVVIAIDPGDPEVMHRPPRDPKVPITNRAALMSWVLYAVALFVAAFIPLVAGPDTVHPTTASASLTMTFVVMGLGTVFNGLTNRRDPASGLDPPIFKAAVVSLFPVIMLVLATQLPVLQSGLITRVVERPRVVGLHRAGAVAACRRRDQQVAAPPPVAAANHHQRAGGGDRRPGRGGGMSAKETNGAKAVKAVKAVKAAKAKVADPAAGTRMKRKDYERELRRLHGELVAMQEWVKSTGAKVCIVFEGRDTAGKGGTIKAITERVSPRVFRVIALPAPNDRERSQMFIQRYIPHLPAAGEVVIFDRSWYNRAGIERVMGFATEEQVQKFLDGSAAGGTHDGRVRHHPGQVLARSQPRRADPPAREPHPRPAQDLEALGHGPQVLQPLVGLRARPRRHVPGHRHRVGTLVRRPHRRQAPRPAQHHHAPLEPRSVRSAGAP